jgi:hypothetical protein
MRLRGLLLGTFLLGLPGVASADDAPPAGWFAFGWSGKSAINCKKADGSAGLLALETRAGCKEERANQAANGP